VPRPVDEEEVVFGDDSKCTSGASDCIKNGPGGSCKTMAKHGTCSKPTKGFCSCIPDK
jgi:hypothetical protein